MSSVIAQHQGQAIPADELPGSGRSRSRLGSWSSRLALATLVLATGVKAAPPRVESWSPEAGTELVLVRDHRVPLVHLTIELPVGTWSPWARANDAAEAFEIQLYDPEKRLRTRADELGIDVELVTDARSARLAISCRRQDLDAVRAWIGDLLAHRDFDRRQVRRRQRTRALGWAAARRDPHFVLAQAQARLFFRPADPRRRGWEKPPRTTTDVRRLAAVRDAMVRLPGRVIALAGDLSREAAERFAAGLLPPIGALPPDLAPRLPPLVAGRHRDRVVPLRRLTQVYFAYCRPSLTMQDPDWPAFLVADHVLGGHFYSRLSVALRHQGGETYGARTVNRGGAEVGSYALQTYTRAANAGAAEEKLRAVLRDFFTAGISEEERRDAVGFLRGRRLFYRQAPEQILRRYLWERRHAFPPGFRDQQVERATARPRAEINAFIRRFYDPAGFVMVKVVPAP